MTSSTEELIAEASAPRGKWKPDRYSLVGRLANALEAAQADLAASQAVIAEVRALMSGPSQTVGEVEALLAQSPADALAAVKAEAWDECARSHALEFGYSVEPLISILRRNPYRTTPTEGASE